MSPDEVTVECSWKIENIDKVWEKILWKEKLSQLAEETNINNCFSMSQKTSDPCPCSLKICLTKNRNFIALQILSEVLLFCFSITLKHCFVRQNPTVSFSKPFKVPMIEVHGQYEEYLMTVRGELLDEVDGSALYECRIDLPKMQSEILLKVVYIRCDVSWVFFKSGLSCIVL